MKKFYYFIPLFILLFSVNFFIFNEDVYNSEYEDEVSNLLDYFKYGELDEEKYTGEEVIHLYDVRKLIQASLAVMFFLAFVIIITMLRESREVIRYGLIRGGVFGVVLTLVASLVLLNFTSAFTKFHELLFTNDYWMLASDTLLIQMFPESFFYGAVVHIVLYSIIFSLVSIVLGVKIPKEGKNGEA